MSLVIRHIRSVPEVCPDCGSRRLSPEEGRREDLPEIAWERPVCTDCGWTGKPVPQSESVPRCLIKMSCSTASVVLATTSVSFLRFR